MFLTFFRPQHSFYTTNVSIHITSVTTNTGKKTKIKVLFFDKNLRRKSIAIKEEKKDEIIPIIIGLIEIKCTISGLTTLTVLIIEIPS